MKTKTFFSLFLLFLLVTVIIMPASAMPPAIVSKADAPPPVPDSVLLLIPILVGSVGVPLVNWLKKTLGWVTDADRIKNVWLTFGVSLGLAILSLLITQSFAPIGGPETLVTWLGLTFTVATLIYKNMQPVTQE
jgi:hypothetical protein